MQTLKLGRQYPVHHDLNETIKQKRLFMNIINLHTYGEEGQGMIVCLLELLRKVQQHNEFLRTVFPDITAVAETLEKNLQELLTLSENIEVTELPAKILEIQDNLSRFARAITDRSGQPGLKLYQWAETLLPERNELQRKLEQLEARLSTPAVVPSAPELESEEQKPASAFLASLQHLLVCLDDIKQSPWISSSLRLAIEKILPVYSADSNSVNVSVLQPLALQLQAELETYEENAQDNRMCYETFQQSFSEALADLQAALYCEVPKKQDKIAQYLRLLNQHLNTLCTFSWLKKDQQKAITVEFEFVVQNIMEIDSAEASQNLTFFFDSSEKTLTTEFDRYQKSVTEAKQDYHHFVRQYTDFERKCVPERDKRSEPLVKIAQLLQNHSRIFHLWGEEGSGLQKSIHRLLSEKSAAGPADLTDSFVEIRAILQILQNKLDKESSDCCQQIEKNESFIDSIHALCKNFTACENAMNALGLGPADAQGGAIAALGAAIKNISQQNVANEAVEECHRSVAYHKEILTLYLEFSTALTNVIAIVEKIFSKQNIPAKISGASTLFFPVAPVATTSFASVAGALDPSLRLPK